MFENAQHVEKEMRATEIHDQKNWRKNRAGDGRNPHGCACQIDMMKQNCAERDHCRHAADSAKEKVEWNFPGPDRRFHYPPTVVTPFLRDRATGNVGAPTRGDSPPPRLLPPLFQSPFCCRGVLQEGDADTSSGT